MPREIQPATRTGNRETHPAFGTIGVVRRSSVPGAVLFDSDIRHGHTVVIEMSEAQWASFVSSMGSKSTPCTLRSTETTWNIPGLEYDPRLAHSMEEVKGAAEKVFGRIQEAVAEYDALPKTATAKQKREAIDKIRNATRNAEANLGFAARSLTEHAENVIQRSKADIEAMAYHAAQAAGLPEGTRLLEIGSSDQE